MQVAVLLTSWLYLLSAQPPSSMVLTAQQFRERRALAKYGKNSAGNLVRATAFRECDYTDLGALREFGDKEEVLEFEEARHQDGTGYRVRFTAVPRETVPPEQRALQAATNHAIAKDGNETRVHIDQTAEELHERHDEQYALLQEIRAHQLQQDVARLAKKADRAARLEELRERATKQRRL